MQLLLIPTSIERERIPVHLRHAWLEAGNKIELCGFGAAVSGATTSRWISIYQPDRAILLGIAGSYSQELRPGEAIRFGRVSCYGIGVGEGDDFRTSSELGWLQSSDNPRISDSIELDPEGAILDSPHSIHELLSVTAASSSMEEVERKLQKYPAAVAEDMEGFSVAAAAKLSETHLEIIRGISNYAGDRNHRSWKIDESLEAAMMLLLGTH